MAEPPRSADRTKVLSVRLTEAEFEALAARAAELGVGPSTLTRSLVRQGLAATAATAPPLVGLTQSSRLEDELAAQLMARVEALEHWVSDHDAPSH